LAGVVALGTLGICSVGTLFAAMSVRTRMREVLLPILLLPALFPVLSGAVRGSTAVLAGKPLPFDALQLLLVIDGIYLIVSFLGFDYILDE
jgi:heme exporter protein B